MKMFEYKVLTEEELMAQRKLLTDGIYQFQSINSEYGYSKTSGNPMITLTLKLWDSSAKEYTVKDYLVASLVYKIKHFWESVGKPEKYNGLNDYHEFNHQSGIVEIKLEKDKNSNSGKEYPRVVDYIKRPDNKIISPSIIETGVVNLVKNDVPEDYIPF
jgi:hypothetical protein